MTVDVERDLVRLSQRDVVAGVGGQCAHDEFGGLSGQHGFCAVTATLHDAVRVQVVHGGHIGIRSVDEQFVVVVQRDVACHVTDLHRDVVGVAVVERFRICFWQRDGPNVGLTRGTSAHCGEVCFVVESDLQALPQFSRSCALKHNRHSHRRGCCGRGDTAKTLCRTELARGSSRIERGHRVARYERHHQFRRCDIEAKSADAFSSAEVTDCALDTAGEGVMTVFIYVGTRHSQRDAAINQVLRDQGVREPTLIAIGVCELQGQFIAHACTRWELHNHLQAVGQLGRTDALAGFGHGHGCRAGEPVDGVDEGL